MARQTTAPVWAGRSSDRAVAAGGEIRVTKLASSENAGDLREHGLALIQLGRELIARAAQLGGDNVSALSSLSSNAEILVLAKAGYDDRSTATIPLIVTYTGNAQKRTPAAATVTRHLPAVNGSALKVSKAKATSFLSAARPSSGIAKVWLDGKRAISLDQSVPQIGAPAAWQAGYTGKGISVGVLDTGIDTSHPDLASKVVGAKNFTTETADDLVGHGTHVASTIAGSGAAAGGKYKGVAPDAQLYSGKVCEVTGCPDSAILAGMEWAATEVKAKVVNLSLGSPDTPEIDPLEEAVNRLTAQTGTLFVIAAGNAGSKPGTLGSPGTADAALTVGAVDKQDHLADFWLPQRGLFGAQVGVRFPSTAQSAGPGPVQARTGRNQTA